MEDAATPLTTYHIDSRGDLLADRSWSDGRAENYWYYRLYKPETTEAQKEALREKLRNGTATRADITSVTQRLGDVISKAEECTHNYGKDNGVDPCDNDWGNYIKIRHKNGTCTLYAHLGYVNVSMGQQVKKGQVIGYAGSTGPSTGYHLHFEIYDTSNTRIDPTPYLVFER